MAIANIVLKNEKGNPVTYEEVKHIKAVEDSGAERIYSDMTMVGAYYGTYDESTRKYTIVERWFVNNGAGYVIAMPNGNYYIILSAKSLTIGNSYTAEELGV